MLKRIGKVLFVFLAVLGALAAAALLWATSEPGSRAISRRLRTQVLAQYAIDVSFENIDLGILPPRLTLLGIDAKDEGGRVACTAMEAELALDIMDLFAGAFTIEEIYLGAPSCVVRLSEADIAAMAKALGDPAASEPSKLDLSSLPLFEVLAVSDGVLEAEIDDPAGLGRVAATVDGLNLDVTGGKESIEVRGLVRSARCTWEKDGDVVDEQVEGFEVRANVSPNAVEVRHATARIAGADLRARDAHIPIPMWPHGPQVADLSLSVPLEVADRLPVDLPRLRGLLGFQGQAAVKKSTDGEKEISARGRVELEDGAVDEFVIGDVSALVSLGPRGVSFSELAIDAAQGRLVLDGSVAFDETYSIRADAKLAGVELAHLLENVTLDGAQVTQRMTGTASVKGQLDPLRLDVTTSLEVADHRVLSAGFRDPGRDVLLYLPRAAVSGRLHIDDRAVVTKGLDVRFGSSAVDVKFRFNLEKSKGWELEANAARFDLRDLGLIAGIEVDGAGTVFARIVDLEYGDPRITGRARLQRGAIGRFAFDEVATAVRFSGLTLLFEDVAARFGQSLCSSTEISLDFGARRAPQITAKIEADRLAIEDLVRVFGIDAKRFGSPRGLLRGRVALDFAGDLDTLRVEGRLDHDRLELFGERFGPERLSFLWEDRALTVDELVVTKGGGRISLTGAVAPDGSLSIMGVAGEVPLEAIDDERVRALSLAGTAQAFVAITGTLDHPKGEADIRLSEVSRRGTEYGPSHLELALDGDVVSGRGTIADRLFTLEHGRLDLGASTFLVEGFARDVDLVSALALDTRGQRVAAEITGELSLAGRLDDGPALTGRATLDEVRFAVNEFEFENKEPVRMTARQDRFTLERTRFKGKDVTFDLSGRASLDRITDLAIAGVMDLRSVADLVEPVTSSGGRLFFDGHVKGDWTAPVFRGEARVEGGRFSIDGLQSAVEDVSGRITLGARKIVFDDFAATSAGGELAMSGQVILDGLDIADYRFRMTIADMELAPFEDLSLRASTYGEGLVLARGQRDLPTITGDVEIAAMRYSEDLKVIDLSDLSVDGLTGTRLRPRRPRTFDDKKDKVAFDIRLHGSRNLEIKNNMVDARLKIDDVEEPLRLVGTNQSFGFLGRVLGTKGQLRFAGKTFELRYAAVSFKDPLRPDNPSFRVTADSEVRDWKITVTAQGTVDDYEIRITSQPYLSQEDLVFLLLTGMTKAEHLQFGSQGITSIGTPLLSTVGGDLIPLEVRIYTEYSEKAGTDTTRISLGKWVTENIWAAFSSSLGEDRDIEANIDYRINDSLSVSLDFDNESQAGNLGIDLKYRKEF